MKTHHKRKKLRQSQDWRGFLPFRKQKKTSTFIISGEYNNIQKKTMTKGTKEIIQYSTSVLLIVAGISMGFISFFLNEHDIETGTLIYIAQCFVAGGSFMGIAVYLDKHIQDAIEILKGHTDEHHSGNDKSNSEK